VSAAARAPRIVVVGSTMIDLSAYTPRVPGPGETVVGERFGMGFGGKGANQALMARLLGAEVYMVNRLGDDMYGRMTLENFDRIGVDRSHVSLVPGSASGVAEVWVEPDGTNRIVIMPGANHDLTPADARRAIEELPPGDVVLGQLEIPQAATAAAFRSARERGALTILNPAPASALDDDLLGVTDWLVPNEVEFALLFGGSGLADADLAAYADACGARLIVTLGEAGAALVTTAGEVIRMPTGDVVAVDSTGAGDAFVGGLSVGLASGLDEAAAVRLGILCASDSVTRHGTQASFRAPPAALDLLAAPAGS
jgi:ribokinase